MPVEARIMGTVAVVATDTIVPGLAVKVMPLATDAITLPELALTVTEKLLVALL